MKRRHFVKTAGAGALGLGLSLRGRELLAAPPATLYNGIRLADPWPPRHRSLSTVPITPPYLVDPPAVIPIDVGRQLFVDDFLIEQTSLSRTFHRAEYHAASPVLRPTKAWELRDAYADRTKTHSNPSAMVFSDGVFFDPQSQLFKMWYMGGYIENTCYAVSRDGLTWEKPALDVVKGTNITIASNRDSSTVWLDHDDPDPQRRYKLAFFHDTYLEQYVSPDGIHWRAVGRSGRTGDRTTFFYNPFRKVWVFSLRADHTGTNRHRRYFETADFSAGTHWGPEDPVTWIGADTADPKRADYKVPAELYNLDCVAYESIVLGLFTIFRGERPEREKPNEICVGYSRDGFHWARPDRSAFIPVSERVGDWNWANVQSAGGCCLVLGDRLYFYVSGRQGVPGTGYPGVCSTGLATLRRDGFVSMDDPGPSRRVERVSPLAPGTLVTRPVRFSGRHLFVNVDAPAGELRVEILDADGRTISPFTANTCVPVHGNSTSARVVWSGATDMAALINRPVRFKFQMKNGALYSFWVSTDTTGASRGYVAAGGPGFTGPIDTTGHR